jgi:hypothetical protein
MAAFHLAIRQPIAASRPAGVKRMKLAAMARVLMQMPKASSERFIAARPDSRTDPENALTDVAAIK